MRIFLAFLILIVCGDMAYGAPRRVLPAAISQSANNNQNTTGSTPPLSRGNNSVKSRAAITSVPAVKSRTAVRAPVSPSPRNSVASVTPRVAARSRAATTTTTAPAALQSLVDMQTSNDECLDSYTKCMDNYCNVLDADLGRCSCSGDITQFAKISDALVTANTELQDVMKKISYLGLSADEITALYTQTAAEGVMGTITDTSKMKSDLNAITNMLVDVKTPSAGAATSGDGISGLLNIDLTANNFDINSVLGTIGGTNTSPLLNQRGEQLYKSAAARCKSSVLKNCIGADENVVVSRYKTEINRACIAYGNALQTKNDDARRMIDNAGRVLQMARLKVQSDKNSYDLKACVAALDTCMRDDFVCGDDWGRCLDASGRYFVNGELISGATESKIMTDIWGAATPASDGAFITQHAANTNIASLVEKIGNPIKRDGLCSNVLNKCQSQWRNGESNAYNAMNNVVLAWLGDAIPKMVVRQRELINDFRTDCVSTVNACMTQQGTPNNIKPRNMQPISSNFLAAQVGACRATIDACAGVMGMSDKQILAQYISKNVCDGYDAVLDMCDGNTHCTGIINNCLNEEIKKYYGSYASFPIRAGQTTKITGGLYKPFIDACAKRIEINDCAESKGQPATDMLVEWITARKTSICQTRSIKDDVCDSFVYDQIKEYLSGDILTQVYSDDKWFPFWGAPYRGNDITNLSSATIIDNLATATRLQKMSLFNSWTGYEIKQHNGGVQIGYMTIGSSPKCNVYTNRNCPDIKYTNQTAQYRALVMFVQGSVDKELSKELTIELKQRMYVCACRMAIPIKNTNDEYEICYSDTIAVPMSDNLDRDIVSCPELCALYLYSNPLPQQVLAVCDSDNSCDTTNVSTTIQQFLKSAFNGSCAN